MYNHVQKNISYTDMILLINRQASKQSTRISRNFSNLTTPNYIYHDISYIKQSKYN